jgi:hypothetical protein
MIGTPGLRIRPSGMQDFNDLNSMSNYKKKFFGFAQKTEKFL